MSQTTTPSGAELNSCLGYLPISDALLAHRAEAQAAGFSGWAEHLPEEVRAQWHEIGIKGRIVAIACCKNQTALIARNAELEADAGRWREVSDKAWFIDAAAYVYGLRTGTFDPTPEEDEVIAAVDAARTPAKENDDG